jgi:hypothetical protein
VLLHFAKENNLVPRVQYAKWLIVSLILTLALIINTKRKKKNNPEEASVIVMQF